MREIKKFLLGLLLLFSLVFTQSSCQVLLAIVNDALTTQNSNNNSNQQDQQQQNDEKTSKGKKQSN